MKLTRRSLLKGVAAAGAAGAAGAVYRRAEARAKKQPPPDAVAMLFDSTRCVGCRACMEKCKEANDLPPDRVRLDGVPYDAPIDLSGTTKTVIKLYQGSGKTAFMKAQCLHCVDPACVSACMLGALNKREYGVVTYEKNKCVGCRYCQIACAFNVPRFEWNSPAPQIVKCEMCHHRFPEGKGPACAEVCPREAIQFGKLKELRAEAQKRIQDNPWRYHPDVFGDTEVGGTQVLYLSAVPFDKLGLPKVGDEPVPAMGETIQHGIYKGFIAPIALYAVTAYVVVRNVRRGEAEEQEEAARKPGEGEERKP